MGSSSGQVFVTGAGGFIGGHIVRRFAKSGWGVTAIVHRNHPAWLDELNGVSVEKCDVSDEKSVAECLARLPSPPDVVVHAAGLASDIGPDKLFRRLNYESVKIMARVPAKKIVFISSSDVYGIRDFNGERESELPFDDNVGNPYPKYKILSERYLAGTLPPERYVCIRPAAVWGEGDKTLEPRIVEFLRTSPFIVHFGKWRGKNRWPLADVRLVAESAYIAATDTCWDGGGVTIIDHKRTTIDEYYRDIAHRYFPAKRYRTITLPTWVGKCLGAFSSLTSRILGRTSPIFDPSCYALHHVSSNLDFDDSKLMSRCVINTTTHEIGRASCRERV